MSCSVFVEVIWECLTRYVVVVLSNDWLVGSSRLLLDPDLQETSRVKSLPQYARMLSW